MHKSKKTLIFLSNNSTKTIETYQSKFSKLFDLDIAKNHIFTSALATASYLSQIASKNDEMDENENKQSESFTFDIKKDKILLIGSIGLYSIIKDFGFEILWTSNDSDFPGLRGMKPGDICDIELDAAVKVVVCGMDQYYTYNDTCLACRYLNELDNTLLVGSNDDTTFPAKPGKVLSGTGSLIAGIKASHPKQNAIVCGKPHRLLFELIQSQHKAIDPKTTLMVGDRLNTDILFGKKCHLDTLLVLTGVTTEKAMNSSEIKSKYYLPSIKHLIDQK